MKIYTEVAGFKIYPEISAAMTLRHMLRRAAFSSVGLEILNLAAARVYSGILAALNSADRFSALRL